MKTRKLKKSLFIIFLSKVYFKSPFFIIQKEKQSVDFFYSYTFLKVLTKIFFFKHTLNSKTFKYPLYIKFFNSFDDIQKNCLDNSEFILLNFKEFFLKTESFILKNSVFSNNSFKHLEFFFLKNSIFFNFIKI